MVARPDKGGTNHERSEYSGNFRQPRLLAGPEPAPFDDPGDGRKAVPGELIAREGETGRAFFLIQSGKVDIETQVPGRGSVRVQTVGPGEVVGWSWLVPPYRWCFDCRAVENAQGLAFDATWLREQCEQDYQLGYHVLTHLVEVIASRLAATRVQLLGGQMESAMRQGPILVQKDAE